MGYAFGLREGIKLQENYIQNWMGKFPQRSFNFVLCNKLVLTLIYAPQANKSSFTFKSSNKTNCVVWWWCDTCYADLGQPFFANMDRIYV